MYPEDIWIVCNTNTLQFALITPESKISTYLRGEEKKSKDAYDEGLDLGDQPSSRHCWFSGLQRFASFLCPGSPSKYCPLWSHTQLEPCSAKGATAHSK